MITNRKYEDIEFDGNVSLKLFGETVFRNCQFLGNVKLEVYGSRQGIFEVNFQVATK